MKKLLNIVVALLAINLTLANVTLSFGNISDNQIEVIADNSNDAIAGFQFVVSANGNFEVMWAYIYKNGSRFLDGGQTTDYGVNYVFYVPTTALVLSSGDYLELYYFHNKGSSLNITNNTTNTQSTQMTVLKIA